MVRTALSPWLDGSARQAVGAVAERVVAAAEVARRRAHLGGTQFVPARPIISHRIVGRTREIARLCGRVPAQSSTNEEAFRCLEDHSHCGARELLEIRRHRWTAAIHPDEGGRGERGGTARRHIAVQLGEQSQPAMRRKRGAPPQRNAPVGMSKPSGVPR